jgi:thiol:disulfide interchange protein
MLRNLLLGLFALACLPAQAQDMPASPIAATKLLLHAPRVVAGDPIRAGVLFTLPEGWHIYWQNPGDSGMPTAFAWTLPEGLSASDIHWPAPESIETDGIFNYGYGGKVILPVDLTPAQNDLTGTVTVQADWLVCKDICIPESATLSATLPATDPQAAQLLDTQAAQLPTPRVGARYRIAGDEVQLTVPADGLELSGEGAQVRWFPVEDGIIKNSSPQTIAVTEGDDGAFMLTLTAARGQAEPVAAWHGILTIAATADDTPRSYTLIAEQDAASGSPIAAAPAAGESLPWLLAASFAFLGGLLLNLMPCVLPVLSLKAMALAKKSGAEARAARAQGLAYALGVVASFLAIAGVMLALKAGGAAIGWGFQLQEPAVIAGLALLMLLVALNLLGQFELPVLLGSVPAHQHTLLGAFFTGALAVALATPCTAPFMAPALGATLAMPATATLAVFTALGLGMAAPFLLISFLPAARALLPRPGAWMARFKQCMAFPMFATMGWLAWVLVQVNGVAGLQLLFFSAIAVAWLVWWAQGTPRRPLRPVLWLLALIASLWGIAAQPAPQTAHATPPGMGEAYSAERLAALRAEGKPVFVDATAAWCLTCKINERVALHTEATQQLFAARGITLMIADWTTRDAAITAYLASFGRNGVPLYVYYPPGGEPIILPQLLTPSLVQQTITDSTPTP